MNKYLKNFLLRGLVFSGLGPVIVGVIYLILENTVEDFSLSGGQVCLAIVSTYILAFVQAGASVFNQIEHWSLPRSLFCHFGIIYIAYVLCYVINYWIPFEPMVLLIFTLIFVTVYLTIWITVYLSAKAASKKLNASLE